MTPRPYTDFTAAHLAREDLYFFARWSFLQRKKFKWARGPHHPVICNALTRVFKGECKRLIINIPPRYSKTELVQAFMAHALGHYPDSEFIYTSYSARLAANSTWAVRETVQSDFYRRIFPCAELKGDSKARDEWRTTDGGVVYGVGSGGTITGYGAGKHRPGFGGAIIIDDPHKADEATSDTIRKGVIDWFQNTLESRKNSPDTPIICIMQRLHVEDLAGWLLDGGNGEAWEHVCLPALRPDGSALWPEKHDVGTLRQMQEAARYTFTGQYQQEPYVPGGNVIKSEWFRRYSVLPPLQYRKIYADTAQKTKESNDYSVFECWGRGDDGRIYLLDLLRGKWEAPELKRQAVAFWAKHAAMPDMERAPLRAMMVEDKSSGTGLIQEISRDETHIIPVKGIERDRDKYTRVLDASPFIEAGRVCIPESAPWVSAFTTECEQFAADDSHPHDDQIDPLCDAVQDMLAGDNLNIWARLAS